jgi:predicted nucleotidyltransferase
MDAQLEARLHDYFARRGDVALAVVFGSVARGDARPGSDLDLGIVPADSAGVDLPPLVGRRVDAADLRRVSPVFGFAVAHDAVLVYEAEPGAWASWFARALARYYDTAPLRRIAREGALDRLGPAQ